MNNQRPEGFEEIEKRNNKFIFIGVAIGAFIGFVLFQNFLGFIVGSFLGGILTIILYYATADKTMKTKIRDYNTYQAKQRQEQTIRELKEKKSLNIKCPTCGSSHIDRISTGKKLAYVATFGILAPAFKKVRSQFQCRQCGYKW